MFRDFYATVAQVLPVLLLGVIFESSYLKRNRTDWQFWSPRRSRLFALIVSAVTVGATLLCVFVLAGTIPDSLALRTVATVVVVLTAVSLWFRIWFDIPKAPAPAPASAPASAEPGAAADTAPGPEPVDKAS